MNTSEMVIILARKLNISQAAARTLLRERLTGFGRELVDQGSELAGEDAPVVR